MMTILSQVVKEVQYELFRKLLCAIYTRPYTIMSCEELEDLTNLADFYRALPILSATIVTALIGSPIFTRKNKYSTEFALRAHELLFIAEKLRNKVLWTECFVHVVGRWKGIQNDNNDAFVRDPIS